MDNQLSNFEIRKKKLEAGYANDPFQNEIRTAESIAEDHERPMRALGNLMLMGGRLQFAGAMVPILETARLRGQGIVPVDYKTIIDDAFMIPRNTSSKYIHKDSNVSVKKGGLLDPNRVNPNYMFKTDESPDQLEIPFDQAKLSAYQQSMKNPNIPLTSRLDLADSVVGSAYRASEPFDYFKFKEQSKFMRDKGRRFLSIFQAGITDYGASKAANFKASQPSITNPLKIEYSRTNLPDTSFQVHHRAALKAIMGNYHGLDIGSPVFNKVTDAILQEVPWLGLGDNPENWMGIIGSTADKGTPHHLAHKYYNKIIGPSGELIFDEPTIERMMVDEDFRIEMATKVGRIINKSNQIVTQATELWELGFSNQERFKSIDDLVNHLSKFDELGYNALSDPEYEAGVFTDIITQIATDPSMVPPPAPKDTRGQENLQKLLRLEELQKDTKEADLSLKEQQKKPKPLSNEQQLNILDETFGIDE
tara:strand:+ start:63 stop:1496 length:1434 start_codon:yes stop_codon:yes gene_type:complete